MRLSQRNAIYENFYNLNSADFMRVRMEGKSAFSGTHKDIHTLYAVMLISLSVLLASTATIHLSGASPGNSLQGLIKGKSYALGSAITGKATAISEANILNTTIGVCKLNLSAGWNMFSSYCQIPNGSVTDTLAYVYQDYKSLYYYDAFDAANPWKAYIPGLPSWVVQGISKMDDRDGYIIYMKTNQTLVVNGTQASPRKVPFASGYSLVGFPYGSALNTSGAFSNSTGTVIAVFWHNGSIANNSNITAYNIGYIGYNLISGTGNLTRIEPGMGIWLNASAGGTWTLG